MKIIGITGGIGSGKSVVSKLLSINGIPVYNTDIAAKRIQDTSESIREQLCARFGEELYQPYGVLNRQRLASFIFNDPENLRFVNSIIHPAVKADFFEWQRTQRGKEWVGIESALLFESGFNRWIDVSISVSAPLEVRISRVQKRDGLEREAVLNRIRNQMPEEERNALADYRFVNDDSRPLIPQIENWLKRLKSE
jgi:dephospho-CoA kinase